MAEFVAAAFAFLVAVSIVSGFIVLAFAASWRSLNRRVDRILFDVHRIVKLEEVEMANLDQLTQEVSEIGTVVDSAIALLAGLKAALDAAGTDPAKLAELSASLDAKANELSAAVAVNTPAA